MSRAHPAIVQETTNPDKMMPGFVVLFCEKLFGDKLMYLQGCITAGTDGMHH